jgi:D-glucosaminate-6-phosphate ammonia-lyase
MDLYERLGLRRVVNAAGKMTYLGASAVEPEVAEALAVSAQGYVEMDRLMDRAGELVAEATGAEAGMVTCAASAGIAISIAACITGTDLYSVQQVPDVQTARRRVVLQKGHAVDFGAQITQMVRMAGGIPVEVGSANDTKLPQLKAALGPDVAAVLYVVSHHAVQDGMLSLAQMAEAAHAAGVPVVVDAAAEVDLQKYLATGADLVVYSGHKAIGGPTSGIIAGKADLVAACRLQNQGIGRPMKIGKEGIIGCLTALDVYCGQTPDALERTTRGLAEALVGALQGISGLTVTAVKDGTRPIWRAQVKLAPQAGLTARKLIARLESGNPVIKTRNHEADSGIINLDTRTITARDVPLLAQAIRTALAGNEVAHA